MDAETAASSSFSNRCEKPYRPAHERHDGEHAHGLLHTASEVAQRLEVPLLQLARGRGAAGVHQQAQAVELACNALLHACKGIIDIVLF